MSRVDQLNSLLLNELGGLASREIYLADGLITVTYVDCSPDLRQAKVGFSVLPDRLTGTALALLKKNNRIFADRLKKKLNIKFIPRLKWEVDARPQRAGRIEETLKELGL